jgi:biopolymer transport protein ExbB
MIVTFNGLSSSRGSALDVVAGGISQALITTQTGLIIAIPGYILVHHAKRRCQELDGFFSELEIRSVQKLEKNQQAS